MKFSPPKQVNSCPPGDRVRSPLQRQRLTCASAPRPPAAAPRPSARASRPRCAQPVHHMQCARGAAGCGRRGACSKGGDPRCSSCCSGPCSGPASCKPRPAAALGPPAAGRGAAGKMAGEGRWAAGGECGAALPAGLVITGCRAGGICALCIGHPVVVCAFASRAL